MTNKFLPVLSRFVFPSNLLQLIITFIYDLFLVNFQFNYYFIRKITWISIPEQQIRSLQMDSHFFCSNILYFWTYFFTISLFLFFFVFLHLKHLKFIYIKVMFVRVYVYIQYKWMKKKKTHIKRFLGQLYKHTYFEYVKAKLLFFI